MAATTYCQSCCRILQVPDDSVGQRVQCSCGNTFRVEKPLAQIQEEERLAEFRRLGAARLESIARRRLGRPLYRRGPFALTLIGALLLTGALLYVDQIFYVPPPVRRPPIQVRLMFANPDRKTAETGTSIQDPIRPPDLPGRGLAAARPGEGESSKPSEVILATSKKPKKDREGARERGKWRLVPEEAKKLWKLDGLSPEQVEGREDPDAVEGLGEPTEGAPARPNPPDEEADADAEGQRGSDPELEALERLSSSSGGGGSRFFGSPIPLDADGIVFLIDRSASMLLPVSPPRDAASSRSRWTKLDLAKWELKKAIALLPEDKTFNVIFFDNCLHRWRYQMHPAKAATKRDAYRWIEKDNPAQGQTNVSEAVVAALGHEGKNRIVLLSDGRPNVIDCRTEAEAPASIHLEKIRQSNKEMEPVWCFSFSEDEESEKFLRELAELTGGEFTPVSAKPF